LIKATWKAFGTAFSLAAFFKIGNDLLAFAGPLLLRKILQFIHNIDEEMWHGLFYAVAMLVCSIFQTLCINAYFTRVYRVGMNVRQSALISFVRN
jgi:ATP-binding cassette subfamily C (CFTR/MRP) protein 1